MIATMQQVSMSRPMIKLNKSQLRGGVAALKPTPGARRAHKAVFAVSAVAVGPMGIPEPAKEPKNLKPPSFGFYATAETINGRAAMLGIFGVCAVEAVFKTNILEIIGVQVGNGINLGF